LMAAVISLPNRFLGAGGCIVRSVEAHSISRIGV